MCVCGGFLNFFFIFFFLSWPHGLNIQVNVTLQVPRGKLVAERQQAKKMPLTKISGFSAKHIYCFLAVSALNSHLYSSSICSNFLILHWVVQPEFHYLESAFHSLMCIWLNLAPDYLKLKAHYSYIFTEHWNIPLPRKHWQRPKFYWNHQDWDL